MIVVGVIGESDIGKQLVRTFRNVGHEVWIVNSSVDSEFLKELTDETGAQEAILEDVFTNSDVVFLCIPPNLLSTTAYFALISSHLSSQKILISTENYYPTSSETRILEIDDENVSETEWLAHLLGRSVIKAFNNISTYSSIHGGLPSGHPDRIALPVSGDDLEEKEIVVKLIDSIGFDGYDAGCLLESWRQEPGTPCFCTDLTQSELISALNTAVREEKDIRRDVIAAQMKFLPQEIIQSRTYVTWIREQMRVSFDEVKHMYYALAN